MPRNGTFYGFAIKHIAGLLIALIVAPIIYLAIDRSPPVVVTSSTISGNIYPGATVNIRWTAYRSDSLPFEGVIRRQFVDSEGVLHEMAEVPAVSREDHTPRKGYTFTRQIVIPPAMAFGPARMIGWRFYERPYNPFHKIWPIRIPIERLDFVVGPAPSGLTRSMRLL